MNRASRRVTNIFGEDAEYSKEIVDDYVHAARSRKGSAIGPQVKPEIEEANPKQNDASTKSTQDKDDKKSLVFVRPNVWPLPRQRDDLLALEAAGFNLDVVLRLARQQTQKRFKLRLEYMSGPKSETGVGKPERINVKVSRADLQSLSDQAGDLGTMPPASLIKAQVQEVWVEELDKVINRLKEKTL